MRTHRLYFDDPYLVRFAAHVVATHGDRVALDRSAFYPEGGGQPADHGMLGDVPVTDVQVDDDGVVWHTLAGPLDTDEVIGVVDWPRRLDHMQQHHGQHLLSAAFETLYQMPTVSFHLGVDSATIDLAAPGLQPAQLEAVESLVNEVIWDNRPIHARFVGREELATIPLRKPPTVEGEVRVVSVPDFDHSACGGTHPTATGAVGMLHIRRTEKRGAETRVEFVCGGRALRDLRWKHGLVTRLAGAASVGLDELEEKVTRLQAEHGALRKELTETRSILRGWIAQEMIDTQGSGGPVRVLSEVFRDRPAEEVRLLAMEVAARNGCALFAAVDGDRATLVFAAPTVPDGGPPCDCGALLREVLAEFGGRGGGQRTLAQGSLADPARAQEAVRWAAERVRG